MNKITVYSTNENTFRIPHEDYLELLDNLEEMFLSLMVLVRWPWKIEGSDKSFKIKLSTISNHVKNINIISDTEVWKKTIYHICNNYF